MMPTPMTAASAQNWPATLEEQLVCVCRHIVTQESRVSILAGIFVSKRDLIKGLILSPDGGNWTISQSLEVLEVHLKQADGERWGGQWRKLLKKLGAGRIEAAHFGMSENRQLIDFLGSCGELATEFPGKFDR